MKDQIEEFRAYRAKMNERILAADNKVIKRIYNIDTNTYMEGALSSKVKEMLGLATSMVLRCDDCIKYHLEKCYEQGVTTPELFEVFALATALSLHCFTVDYRYPSFEKSCRILGAVAGSNRPGGRKRKIKHEV